uniref:Uncharacterized protein n=1 Tax=Chromera velia CCMP2878 TaxID=1169474 RepID=A0A0G4IEQ3_9ALVE|eukprot:Cvel_13787.t1-p1 / transcript=Cvel_13787.t1 / gene=Cvel_13787 / organism=Chromera_velia_CCMP2878 / gene_product=hypothetical protein / transcript_product=hypothetical protein / location=Cvel_scaffold955:36861-37340(+) / protein_length=160 / sequence_SO=supercontig / SO=protein_coding / is_pseudo=false
MRVAQPGYEINARMLPFFGTLYPLLSIEITTEPAYKEYAKLIPRVLFLHQQEQKKGPNPSARMAPAAKSANDVKQLRAQISIFSAIQYRLTAETCAVPPRSVGCPAAVDGGIVWMWIQRRGTWRELERERGERTRMPYFLFVFLKYPRREYAGAFQLCGV